MVLQVVNIKPLHMEAGLTSDTTEREVFDINVRIVGDETAILFGTMTLQEDGERVVVGVAGHVRKRDFDDLQKRHDPADLVEILNESILRDGIARTFYTTAALVARQMIATIMLSMEVPTFDKEMVSVDISYLDPNDLEPQ